MGGAGNRPLGSNCGKASNNGSRRTKSSSHVTLGDAAARCTNGFRQEMWRDLEAYTFRRSRHSKTFSEAAHHSQVGLNDLTKSFRQKRRSLVEACRCSPVATATVPILVDVGGRRRVGAARYGVITSPWTATSSTPCSLSRISGCRDRRLYPLARPRAERHLLPLLPAPIPF